MRANSLLKALIAKNQFSAALLVASRHAAFANAYSEGQAENFMCDSIRVFIELGKIQAGFDFLAAIE